MQIHFDFHDPDDANDANIDDENDDSENDNSGSDFWSIHLWFSSNYFVHVSNVVV